MHAPGTPAADVLTGPRRALEGGGLPGRQTADGALDPRIRVRAPLRCDGVGRLDWAEDAATGERLAVRWLPMSANGREAVRACERLPLHPVIPRVVQTGTSGALAFVAMEFPEGELLSALLLEGTTLEPALVLRLAARLASALAAVHEQGLVHGELSLDSVLLAPGGRAFLWDLPLVMANRHSDRRSEHRALLALLKTAPFLAPECARGGPATPAADVHALGAILCRAAGAPAVPDSGTLALVHRAASGASPHRAPAGLAEPWRTLVQRMVSPEPLERPAASELAWALRSLVPGAPPAAGFDGEDVTGGPLLLATLVPPPAREATPLRSAPGPEAAAGRPEARPRRGLFIGGGVSAVLLAALATYLGLSMASQASDEVAPLAGTVRRPPPPRGEALEPLPRGLRSPQPGPAPGR